MKGGGSMPNHTTAMGFLKAEWFFGGRCTGRPASLPAQQVAGDNQLLNF